MPTAVAEIAKALSEEIQHLFPGSKILLFGSYAKGTFNSQSDIDIAVFLPEAYRPRGLMTIFRELCRLSGKYNYDIQPQVFFDDEFDSPAGIIEEIIEFGIDIT